MQEEETLNTLKKVGAIVTNSHIVYTSGKHGSAYVNKDAIYPHTDLISNLCKKIASHFQNKNIHVVIAPALGGIILSQWIAHHLSKLTNNEVLAVYAEKEENTKNFIIKRGYDKLIKNKNVLVVEDILTTGGSAKKVIDIVKNLKGNIKGFAALCNRGNIKPEDIGAPSDFFTLTNIDLQTWDKNNCPLCKQSIPINTELGKGKEFLKG